jgi:hypothetical protein
MYTIWDKISDIEMVVLLGVLIVAIVVVLAGFIKQTWFETKK